MKPRFPPGFIQIEADEAERLYIAALAAVGPIARRHETDSEQKYMEFRKTIYGNMARFSSYTPGSIQNYQIWCKQHGKKF